MSRASDRRTMRRAMWAAAASGMWLLGGCQAPGTTGSGWAGLVKPKTTQPATPPVARIVCFFTQPIFLSFDPYGNRNPNGFRCTMYFVSQETGKGVHADGTLRVDMYRSDYQPDGKLSRTLAQEWVVGTSELACAKKETALGWGYQPTFSWGDQDLLGKEIELVFYFESPDGHMARSQTTHLKVPSR